MSSISVLAVEPGKRPSLISIDNDIAIFENIVNGPVDLLPFHRSPFKIVCHLNDSFELSTKKPENTFFIVKHTDVFLGIDRTEAEELREVLRTKLKKWK
ncbi:hypothetical protein ACQCVB_02730 [Fictibacillus phosphorivorans]|uniref:hypothetical protein n=1 Tax=Fictibacillus phosphorivorans TaxID=1221500 RepID=UPI003CF6B1D0